MIVQPAITLGAINYVNYRANDIFNVDGSSHQPFGWAQLIQLYNNWVVLGSKLTAVATPAQSSGTAPGVGLIMGADCSSQPSGIVFSSAQEYQEARRGTWRILTFSRDKAGDAVRSTYSFKKLYHTRPEGVDAENWGSTTTSPSDISTFGLWFDDGGVSSGTPNVGAGFYNVQVIIDYYVLWANPTGVFQS